ncbi:unnamed protein product [Rotaria socialis]|uniref:FHF complex subunit HOOK-interacting protein C-terminal domain-containing protein n=1 Tax=Rotaria socialis TaxID=392032 RepID=A0A818KN51_9BILA|nr:unnamed protein product [Rotaria socialis]
MTLQWKRHHSVESLDDETSIELTVLRQHWKQILQIFQKSLIDQDDITCVTSHFQHAVTLLTNEVASHDRPGPVLLYFIAESILDTFFVWSLSCPEYASDLKYHQLRCFEFLLSRAQHELLFHKQIFKPLLNLLRSCESSTSLELIEKHMIVVLNQVCVSITRNPTLLELCFDISAEHGPSKFVIFSLLIPFVHRDGLADKPSALGITTGQQARDALLLIMQLSYRNEPIAKYIVENTNFCPILATGLSALYSDLPHRLATNNDEWFILTKQEWSENPSLVQFMNSLQFCNDVIQIAHPIIGHHLLQFIYHGFLVPVLGPSIHQDLHEIPLKFSDLQHFSNTMDEVIAATAYLDLFIRTIYEPALLRVFLKFILCAKIDEMSLLDTLIQRISFTTKLGLVSLSLFYTLINLNCEDVMYRLIFMYLIPCRHVMCSQRRHITNVEIYGKNAEKFLTLRPSFANKTNDKDSNGTPQSKQVRVSFDQTDESNERYECSFGAYLEDAHFSIVRCRVACRCWTAPYDGEVPSSDTNIEENDFISLASSISSFNTDNNNSKKSGHISNQKQSINFGKNVAASNDSGIHVDGLEINSQLESQTKPTEESFQLPSWLANNQPIPEELLTKHSTMMNHSTYHYEQTDDDDIDYYQHPSSFYALSFIDFSGENEDTWSVNSSNTPNVHIRDEIKTCVETLHSCLSHFREMNEQPNEIDENIDDDIKTLVNELLDQVNSSIEKFQLDEVDSINIQLDFNLLNELLTKKLTFQEYLIVLDRLIDSKYLTKSAKTSDELYNEILLLVEQIEQYRTIIITEHNHNTDVDNQYFSQFIINAQSNYSVMSFLQQSTSMDMSLIAINDLSNQIQSNIFTTSIQPQQTSINNGKPADIGPFLRTIFIKLENMLHNSLYVNLLLTGIISRLAHYPQPLLRSLLLNHSLVLETNVKSLFQILSNLKSKLEVVSQTFNDFNYLVELAHETLYQKEKAAKDLDGIQKRARSPSRTRSKSADPGKERVTKRSRILDFFRGRSRASERTDSNVKERDHSHVTLIDKTSMKFINIRENPQNPPTNEWDDPKTRNVAYCAVVFNQFLKELAAVTLEHSVQQFDDDKIFDDLPLTQLLL